MRYQFFAALILAALLTCPAYGSVTATASSAGGHAAQAVFDVVDGNLIIKVTNLSKRDATSKRDILTGIYFDTSKPMSLKYLNAGKGEKSRMLRGGDPSSLKDKWAFASGSKSLQASGSRYGLGTVSMGGLFSGVKGANFGLTSANDNASTFGKQLLKNEIVFVLTGLPRNFDPETGITGVVFQYGTKKKGSRLVGDLAASVESLAHLVNKMPPLDGTNPRTGGRDAVATPAPTALAGGLLLLGAMLARRRRG